MQSKVTVIVPFYKPPKLSFRKCIESILGQSFKEFELFLISDGSPENIVTIAKEYSAQDIRIKLLFKENGGVSSARNFGIKRAKGEYILFVDSDDWIEDNFISKMYNAVKNVDLAICGVATQYFHVFDRFEDRRLFFSQPTRYNGIQYINFCCNKIFRKNIIEKNNILFQQNVSLGEDALFLNEYFKYCKAVRCISNCLYHYEYNINSAVFSYNKQFWNMEKLVIQVQWKLFHQYPLCEYEEQAMLAWLYIKFKNAFYYYINNEKDKYKIIEFIREISSHELYKKLIYSDISNNKHLNSNDKKIIMMWRVLGGQGVIFTKKISRIYKTIAH